jgi:hypothetical protein
VSIFVPGTEVQVWLAPNRRTDERHGERGVVVDSYPGHWIAVRLEDGKKVVFLPEQIRQVGEEVHDGRGIVGVLMDALDVEDGRSSAGAELRFGLTEREERIARYLVDLTDRLRGPGPLEKSKAMRLLVYAGELLCALQAERLQRLGVSGR